MEKIIYSLCALTAAACATLLLRRYLQTRFRLLLWSGLCFAGLTLNNMLLVADRLIFTTVDLSTWRLAMGLAAIVLLLWGLIMDGGT
jgi:hypothetical protein